MAETDASTAATVARDDHATSIAGDGGAPVDGQGSGPMATTPTYVHVPTDAPALQGGAAAPGTTADGAPTPQGGVVAHGAPLAPPAHTSPPPHPNHSPTGSHSSASAASALRKRNAPLRPLLPAGAQISSARVVVGGARGAGTSASTPCADLPSKPTQSDPQVPKILRARRRRLPRKRRHEHVPGAPRRRLPGGCGEGAADRRGPEHPGSRAAGP